MVKLVDTLGSGSSGSNPMGVRVPLRAQETIYKKIHSSLLTGS